ncbi:unnamed protein product [Amoebophrya sp. A25]|nr:unnamed protein product [Amoebophrya sp. A25]|eukprot:GSA25T00012624001.1
MGFLRSAVLVRCPSASAKMLFIFMFVRVISVATGVRAALFGQHPSHSHLNISPATETSSPDTDCTWDVDQYFAAEKKIAKLLRQREIEEDGHDDLGKSPYSSKPEKIEAELDLPGSRPKSDWEQYAKESIDRQLKGKKVVTPNQRILQRQKRGSNTREESRSEREMALEETAEAAAAAWHRYTRCLRAMSPRVAMFSTLEMFHEFDFSRHLRWGNGASLGKAKRSVKELVDSLRSARPLFSVAICMRSDETVKAWESFLLWDIELNSEVSPAEHWYRLHAVSKHIQEGSDSLFPDMVEQEDIACYMQGILGSQREKLIAAEVAFYDTTGGETSGIIFGTPAATRRADEGRQIIINQEHATGREVSQVPTGNLLNSSLFEGRTIDADDLVTGGGGKGGRSTSIAKTKQRLAGFLARPQARDQHDSTREDQNIKSRREDATGGAVDALSTGVRKLKIGGAADSLHSSASGAASSSSHVRSEEQSKATSIEQKTGGKAGKTKEKEMKMFITDRFPFDLEEVFGELAMALNDAVLEGRRLRRQSGEEKQSANEVRFGLRNLKQLHEDSKSNRRTCSTKGLLGCEKWYTFKDIRNTIPIDILAEELAQKVDYIFSGRCSDSFDDLVDQIRMVSSSLGDDGRQEAELELLLDLLADDLRHFYYEFSLPFNLHGRDQEQTRGIIQAVAKRLKRTLAAEKFSFSLVVELRCNKNPAKAEKSASTNRGRSPSGPRPSGGNGGRGDGPRDGDEDDAGMEEDGSSGARRGSMASGSGSRSSGIGGSPSSAKKRTSEGGPTQEVDAHAFLWRRILEGASMNAGEDLSAKSNIKIEDLDEETVRALKICFPNGREFLRSAQPACAGGTLLRIVDGCVMNPEGEKRQQTDRVCGRAIGRRQSGTREALQDTGVLQKDADQVQREEFSVIDAASATDDGSGSDNDDAPDDVGFYYRDNHNDDDHGDEDHGDDDDDANNAQGGARIRGAIPAEQPVKPRRHSDELAVHFFVCIIIRMLQALWRIVCKMISEAAVPLRLGYRIYVDVLYGPPDWRDVIPEEAGARPVYGTGLLDPNENLDEVEKEQEGSASLPPNYVQRAFRDYLEKLKMREKYMRNRNYPDAVLLRLWLERAAIIFQSTPDKAWKHYTERDRAKRRGMRIRPVQEEIQRLEALVQHYEDDQAAERLPGLAQQYEDDPPRDAPPAILSIREEEGRGKGLTDVSPHMRNERQKLLLSSMDDEEIARNRAMRKKITLVLKRCMEGLKTQERLSNIREGTSFFEIEEAARMAYLLGEELDETLGRTTADTDRQAHQYIFGGGAAEAEHRPGEVHPGMRRLIEDHLRAAFEARKIVYDSDLSLRISARIYATALLRVFADFQIEVCGLKALIRVASVVVCTLVVGCSLGSFLDRAAALEPLDRAAALVHRSVDRAATRDDILRALYPGYNEYEIRAVAEEAAKAARPRELRKRLFERLHEQIEARAEGVAELAELMAKMPQMDATKMQHLLSKLWGIQLQIELSDVLEVEQKADVALILGTSLDEPEPLQEKHWLHSVGGSQGTCDAGEGWLFSLDTCDVED